MNNTTIEKIKRLIMMSIFLDQEYKKNLITLLDNMSDKWLEKLEQLLQWNQNKEMEYIKNLMNTKIDVSKFRQFINESNQYMKSY